MSNHPLSPSPRVFSPSLTEYLKPIKTHSTTAKDDTTSSKNDTEVLVCVQTVPNASHTEAPPSPPPPVTESTTSRRFRLRFLSPTTEVDVRAADYSTAYPRVCSVEYLIAAITCFTILLYGFTVLRAFCSDHFHVYEEDLSVANPFLETLGSKGYDDVVDNQWTGFIAHYLHFAIMALVLGAFSRLCRERPPSSLAAPPPPPPLSSNNSAPSQFTEERESLEVLNGHTQAWVPPSGLRHLGSLTHAREYASASWRSCTAFPRQVWVLPLFYAMAGTVFLAVAHGPYFLLPMLIITANYLVFSRLQRLCPYWLFMAIMWTTHVTLLYIIDVYGGFEQMYWVQYCFTTASNEQAADSAGHNRKPLWHVYMLWWVAYRMTMLRLIAFNYDLWESTHAASHARERATVKHDTICVECAQLHQQNAASPASLPAEASRCYKYRTEYARDAADYNFVNYIAYVLFPPLYLAGPMSSFNAFVSYMRVPSTSMPLRKMVGYLFSILSTYLTTLFVLHSVHIPALAKHSYLIAEMTFIEQSHYFFFSLAYLWLKFNFFWKSSRLFAMLSGIEAPEDMRRCFNSAYTVREFWRDWHASFNLWVVRYMYIPMGGRSRVALSVLPIFLFIAVWHDPALHLIKWALCIAVMFVVELVVSELFGRLVAAFRREMAAAAVATPGMTGDTVTDSNEGTDFAPPRNLIGRLAKLVVRSLSPLKRAWAYRALRILGGIGSISGLIFANLVGFSMQNEHSSMEKVGTTQKSLDADTAFVRTLRQVTLPFLLGYFFFLYCTLSIGILTRDMEANELRSLKKLYKLT
ncbi:hypothetical protein JKF63_05840 [Porcisia hertigi]|uniref:Glycerol uptake protein n=1 Tax=Porcisia hertigi TaxID=2761500 RepID=A0A836LCL0_9TRYP|nr:hypothetical protein JKF63_05840 [Porcisia hertigi]